jgi:PAS domain S-box-containing protein
MLRNILNRAYDLLDNLKAADFLGPLALRLYLAPVFWVAGMNKAAGFSGVVEWFGNPDWGLGLPAPMLMAGLATGAEVLGKQIDFVPEENWPETRQVIEKMLSGKKIQLFETKRLTKDGRVLDVQISSTLYLNRTGEPVGNIVTLRDISAQKKAEIELRQYHDHLEELVGERTAELAKINAQYALEIEERKRAEDSLRKREVELKAQSHHLEEVNTALKVLLKQREDDKKELGENVLINVKELIAPYLDRLKKSRLNTNQETLVNILDSNLNNIISPFISKMSFRFFNLTPMEIKVANLVKEGKTNKEIADLLCLSKNTILFHRYNIRRKLQLKNKKINLRSHLLSYDR